jgi:starvation-inducible DNA-binding protein
MKMQIGLEEKDRSGSATILNHLLSDEFLLYTKTRNYHWNVTGRDFYELHKFFEAQYEVLDEIMDAVAERVRALGFMAFGTMEQFQRFSRLKEAISDAQSTGNMLQNLLNDHETIIRHLREDQQAAAEKYHDAGTSDFLTGLMEQHEKMAWMLRSFLS